MPKQQTKNSKSDNNIAPESPKKIFMLPTADEENENGFNVEKNDPFYEPKNSEIPLLEDSSSFSGDYNPFESETLKKIEEYNVFIKKEIGGSTNPLPNKVSKHRNVLKRTIRLFLEAMTDKRKSWYPEEVDKETKKSMNKRIKVLKEEVFIEGKKACFSLKNMKTLFNYDQQEGKILRNIFQNILGSEIIPNSLFCPELNRSKGSLKLYLICMKAQRLRCRNRSLILRTQFS